ncbi:MAG TPA: hypothetical protein VN717_10370, partial [Gemmatimonadaceae bacterium]|nr:hypothetical protein [Gemmatimonadaceae bacterium]
RDRKQEPPRAREHHVQRCSRLVRNAEGVHRRGQLTRIPEREPRRQRAGVRGAEEERRGE